MSLSESTAWAYSRINAQRAFRPSAVTLPNQRFFTPTDSFWQFLAEHQHIDIVDCGTGKGDLLEEARSRGLKLRGVDWLPREGQSELVELMDANDITWSPTRWPMICRPDHGGWAFDVLQIAKQLGAAGFYIGLGHNYYTDINGLHSSRQKGVYGVEGERLYVMPPSKKSSRSRTNRKLNA